MANDKNNIKAFDPQMEHEMQFTISDAALSSLSMAVGMMTFNDLQKTIKTLYTNEYGLVEFTIVKLQQNQIMFQIDINQILDNINSKKRNLTEVKEVASIFSNFLNIIKK
jgi:hypothetical protein